MPVVEGPRACRTDELSALRILEDTVFRSPGTTSMFDEFPTLFAPANLERVRVIAEDERVVSTIGYLTRTVTIYGNQLKVGSLGAVCTYEECRGKGYATQLLEDSFEQARSEGVDVMLISGQRGLYQRAGCAIGGYEVRYTLDQQTMSHLPEDSGLDIAEARDENIDDLIALSRTEPARYIRSTTDWLGFLKICRLIQPNCPPPHGTKRCWLVRRDGVPVSVVVMQYSHETESPQAQVTEISGDRQTAFAAIHSIGLEGGFVSVGGAVSPEDGEAIEILRQADATVEHQLLTGHRMTILNSDIFERYQSWLTERVGEREAKALHLKQTDGDWRIVTSAGDVSVGDTESVNAILFADGVADIEGPVGAVSILRRALPLPWLLPELNYI
jgi:predicted N-acetyltransferase YhbS